MEWIFSAVGGLARAVPEIGKLIVLGLLLALMLRIVWFLVGIWAPLHARPALRKVRGWFAPLGPLAQILLCVTTVLATALILRVPKAGPWASVMAQDHGAGLSTSMLAGAAALLVLLTFAGSRARWAEEDARDNGATYMGQVLATYRFLNSPWTALTRQRAFQALVITLFVVPLVLTVVPAGPSIPWTALLAEGAVSAEDLLTALWCAAFALVGSTLIMHLASSLRVSMPNTTFVQHQIRWDLEEESRADWNDLLRASAAKDPPLRILHEWTQHHLSAARALPIAERAGYLRATVCQGELLDIAERHLSRAVRKLERADRADPANPGVRVGGSLHTVWRTWPQALKVTRRRRRAGEIVDAFSRAHRALIDAFTDALTTRTDDEDLLDGDTAATAELLSRGVVLSGQQIDAAHTKLTGIGASALAESLLTPSAALPDRSFNQGRPWHDGAESPKVLTITATGFRDLARAAYYPWKRKDSPTSLGLPLTDLVEAAQQIQHHPTREYVLDEIVTDFLRGIVIGGSPVEDPGALEKIWTRGRENSAHRNERSTAEEPLAKLIERRAFSVLTHSVDLAPKAREHLLALLTGWRIPCALLHALLYARRSGRELSAVQLAPYATAMQSATPLSPEALDDLEANALEIIRDPDYNTSHFTSDAGVSWLVRSLGERLTPDLCIEFAGRRESFQILELRLLDLVQWHLVAGTGFGTSLDAHDPTLLEPAVRDSTAALWQFSRSWGTVHTRQARELRFWLCYAVGPEPEHETSSHYTWAVRTRLAGLNEH